MKRKFLLMIITLVFMFLFCSGGLSVSANSRSIPDVSPYIQESDDYYLNNNNFVVYGNYSNLRKNQLKNIIENLGSKTLVIYFTHADVTNNYQLSYYESNITLIYYKNGVIYQDDYTTNYKEFNSLKNEYIDFYNEKMNSSLENRIALASSVDSSLFTLMKSGTSRKAGAPYGYIDISYEVKKYRVNSVSSLYIIDFDAHFTCGRMANMNGDTSYNGYTMQSGAYVHLMAEQTEDWEDAYYMGGVPVYKDYWPLNAPATATITSSYSESLTMGYSFTNGFSTQDEYTLESGMEVGTSIEYAYSKSYTNTEPYMSAQLSSSNSSQAQWTYLFQNDRDETLHTNNFYLFEMNNAGHSMCEGDFDLYFDVKATFKTAVYNIWGTLIDWEYNNVQLEKTINIWTH